MVAGAVTLFIVNLAMEPLLRAQSPQFMATAKVRQPDESTGIDTIVPTLISAFGQTDIVVLGGAPGQKLDKEHECKPIQIAC